MAGVVLKTGSYVYFLLETGKIVRYVNNTQVCKDLLSDAEDLKVVTYKSDTAHYGKSFLKFIDTGLEDSMDKDIFIKEYNSMKKEYLDNGDGFLTEGYCREFRKVYEIVTGSKCRKTDLDMDFIEDFVRTKLIPFLNSIVYETETEESDLRDAAATYAFNKRGYVRKLKTASKRPKKTDLLKICSDNDVLIDLKLVSGSADLHTRVTYEALLQRGITVDLLNGCQWGIYRKAGEDFRVRMHEKYLQNGDRRYEVKMSQLRVYNAVWLKDSGVLKFKIGIRD